MATTLASLKTYFDITDSSQDEKLSLFLSLAENKVLNKRYPFDYTDDEKTATLEKYSDIVFDIAVYLYAKQGIEGQSGSSENGMSRSFDSSGIPDSYVQDIIPLAKLM